MNTILKAEKLNKELSLDKNNTQHILKDIALDIQKGEFVTVMGPSGSGKSTLLYCVSGMDNVTSGNVYFEEQNLGNLKEEELAKLRLNKMGFVFQQSNFMKNLNIFDNIVLSSYLAKKESREKLNRRAEELMKNTGIAQLKENDITQVSGGQLQRASICRALMNNPSILFGDEPTGALNSRATGEVMNIFSQVNEAGTTIFMVTHDRKVAAQSERVLFMIDGTIVADKKMGKYSAETKKQRETELSNWLDELGF